MKLSPYRPIVHLFVCVNQRNETDPLGGGGGERGEQIFAALKQRTLGSSTWVARSRCLGLCPKRGCTVMAAPAMKYFVEVEAGDLDALVSAAR
jgi:hypothetical protein